MFHRTLKKMPKAYAGMVNSLFDILFKKSFGYSFVPRIRVFVYNLDILITVIGISSNEFDNELPRDLSLDSRVQELIFSTITKQF